MTQTEWIISLDDDLKDHDEIFVGNVRDGDVLIRCKDCKYYDVLNEVRGNCSEYNFVEKIPIDYCSWAERREE